jgi:hypothetical protein
MLTEFESVKSRYALGLGVRDLHVTAALRTVERLETAATKAVYEENERGGEARQVVANVARVLGVDIDEGDGHRWDPDHMARVVDGAQRLSDDRDHWQQEAGNEKQQAELWRSLAQRQDDTALLRRDLRIAERERDEWKARYEGAKANAEYVREEYTAPDVAEQMKAAIVRQAREISLLSGEAP